jgi:hypothetical protein
MEVQTNKDEWLKSKDAMKALRISSCDLMHLRVEGKLNFKKEGNHFLYRKNDIVKSKKI